MPLYKIQVDILRLLAARFSEEIDVFQDGAERVSQAALNDAGVLAEAGYRIEWFRRQPMIYTAGVTKDQEGTRLEWVVDSDYRFFPTMREELFGYVLYPVDLAMNKVMAAAGRRELRDLVDLVTIHETILPLGALVWAAVEKSPGFMPAALVAEIRRNSNYPVTEWRQLTSSETVDPKIILGRLRTAFEEAEAFCQTMPTNWAGLLFLKDGKVVQPDPSRLAEYQTHAGQRRGQWPSSPEISGAMSEFYQRPPASSQ